MKIEKKLVATCISALVCFSFACKSTQDDDYSTSSYSEGYVDQKFMICPLVSLRSFPGLRLIGEVHSFRQSEISCTGSPASPSCGGIEDVTQPGIQLNLCSEKSYLPNSVQGVSVDFVRNLEATYGFARDHGFTVGERQLKLQILPKRFRVFVLSLIHI